MITSLAHAKWLNAPETREVMAALETARAGGSRFVGGCVRNSLLNEPVSDIDIATQLTPDETLAALKSAGIRAIPTGYEHGTITAVVRGVPFEITTLRRDLETDGRRAVVAFTTDWAEDAARRDFGMNALYADTQGSVYDPTGCGLADISARRIRFIGEAHERLCEDHLRNLRFFRFTAWYARETDANGLKACKELRDGLKQIAAERIWKEFHRLMEAESPFHAVEAMKATGVLDVILPECAGLKRIAGLADVEARVGRPSDAMQRMICLLQDDSAVMSAIAGRLRLSGDEKLRLVSFAKGAGSLSADMDEQAVKAALYRLTPQSGEDIALWHWAGEGGVNWEPIYQLAKSWQRPVFPVTGADMIARGMRPGPDMGEALRTLETRWIENGFSMEGLNV